MTMAKITNNGREKLDFNVGVKDGQAVTDHIEPGETKDLEVDMESATIKGRIQAGLITVANSSRRAGKGESPAS
jgi:hypothetical protein